MKGRYGRISDQHRVYLTELLKRNLSYMYIERQILFESDLVDKSDILPYNRVKPFLKWAGGKTQMLDFLVGHIPKSYGKYIEPFLGGGALYFYLQPKEAVLSDSNQELINCYEVVKNSPNELITKLKKYKNENKFYYEIRSLDVNKLDVIERAARFIFLNKTCYNGLYRVNKQGQFNVPYGKNNNANICDVERINAASKILQSATLICDDYKAVIRRYAQENDFIFFDPPYHPMGGFADFQRYTKDYFYEADHIELRNEFHRLSAIGTKVVLTNSNTTFVKELFKGVHFVEIDTKRLISSKSETRTGQDLIFFSTDKKRMINQKEELLFNFPGTRYMGSKYKILPFLWNSINGLEFKTVLDAFSGSGCVSYMLKQKGLEVYSNDFLALSGSISKALIENSTIKVTSEDLSQLLDEQNKTTHFISKTFKNLYFDDEDNDFLDYVRFNIDLLNDPYKKAIALAALTRACMKKRPRGIFTYVGQRYDDGRRDIRLTLKEHFLENIESFNSAIFNNGKHNLSFNKDIFKLDVNADLVYFDPPYLTSKSDNDYIRRYHFVEGLTRNWEGIEIEEHTKTKKFKKYPSPFDSKNTVNDALDMLFNKHKESILVVSYSSNSIPTKKEMIKLLKKYKNNVELKEIDYQYSFGNQNHRIGDNANTVKEYLFIAK